MNPTIVRIVTTSVLGCNICTSIGSICSRWGWSRQRRSYSDGKMPQRWSSDNDGWTPHGGQATVGDFWADQQNFDVFVLVWLVSQCFNSIISILIYKKWVTDRTPPVASGIYSVQPTTTRTMANILPAWCVCVANSDWRRLGIDGCAGRRKKTTAVRRRQADIT